MVKFGIAKMLKKSAKLFGLLKNEKNDIDAMLLYVSQEKFNKKQSESQWSIAQIIAHIYLAETQTLEATQWRMTNKTEFPKVGIMAYLRVYSSILLFKLKIKIKAPPFVTPQNEPIDKLTLLEKWQITRANWSSIVYSFPNKLEDKVVYKHPILGYLSLCLALTFMYRHLLRHKGQLKKLI